MKGGVYRMLTEEATYNLKIFFESNQTNIQ